MCIRYAPRGEREPLDLDDHGEHHRPAAGAVVDDAAEGVVQVLLQKLDLGHVVGE